MAQYKGNGKLLLDQVKEIAKAYPISEIILTPGLHLNVIKYYENNGFTQDGFEMIYNVNKGGKTKTRKTIKTKTMKTKKTRNFYQRR